MIATSVSPVACRRNILPNDWREAESKDFGRAYRKIWRAYSVGIGYAIVVSVDEPVVK